jgi:hypothetical protein
MLDRRKFLLLSMTSLVHSGCLERIFTGIEGKTFHVDEVAGFAKSYEKKFGIDLLQSKISFSKKNRADLLRIQKLIDSDLEMGKFVSIDEFILTKTEIEILIQFARGSF